MLPTNAISFELAFMRLAATLRAVSISRHQAPVLTPPFSVTSAAHRAMAAAAAPLIGPTAAWSKNAHWRVTGKRSFLQDASAALLNE